MKSSCKWILGILAITCFAGSVYGDDEEQFEKTEIRVIRPRFFNKKHRFELGVQAAAIVNQTFYYTFLGTGSIGFHFNEQIGIELVGGYGFSRENEDQVILIEDFDIQPQNAPVQMFYGGNLLWTPMYGKYQLGSGYLVYFDTFVSAGAGILGVKENFSHCPATNPKGSQLNKYPYLEFGLGQRYFLSKNDSMRWDIKAPMYKSNTADSSCFENATGDSQFNYHVSFQLGYSRFI